MATRYYMIRIDQSGRWWEAEPCDSWEAAKAREASYRGKLPPGVSMLAWCQTGSINPCNGGTQLADSERNSP